MMTGISATQRRAEMAGELGAFPCYARKTPTHMLRVIRNHRRAAISGLVDEYEGLSVQAGRSSTHEALPLTEAVG